MIPIKCFSCNKVLANAWSYYQDKVTAKVRDLDMQGKKPDDVEKDHFDTLCTGDILDELGLTRICCRSTMMSSIDLAGILT